MLLVLSLLFDFWASAETNLKIQLDCRKSFGPETNWEIRILETFILGFICKKKKLLISY